MAKTKSEAKKENRKPGQDKPARSAKESAAKPEEHGGPKGLEPTRYGDWERKGIAVDF